MADTNSAGVTFAIPLRRPRSVADRRKLDEELSHTLRAIFQQTRGDFHVLLGSAYRPELPSFVDDRLEHITIAGFQPSTWEDGVRESGMRQFQLGQRFAELGGGYLMYVDHDDFISNRLVEYVLGGNHPHGYAAATGYLFDAAANALSPYPIEGFSDHAFHQFCGTSLVLRLTPEDVLGRGDGKQPLLGRVYSHGHNEVVVRMRAEGRPLEMFPFRAAVYVRNHGANLSNRVQGPDTPAAYAWVRDLDSEVYRTRIVDDAPVREEFAIPAQYACHTGNEVAQSSPPACKLSVLICTYRRPKGLRQVLAAVVPQLGNSTSRELVVVNDGSHDDAYQAVVDEFGDRIRYHALPKNVGVAAARNEAARLARNDYVIFTDDDCEPPSFWLDWIAAKLASHPELDYVAGATRPLWPEKPGFFAKVRATHDLIPVAHRADGMIIFPTANVAIKRSVFEAMGGFGFPDFHGAAEDTELSARLALRGAAGAFDSSWYTCHEITEGFFDLCRRYRRYGYANGRLVRLTTSPASNDYMQNTWNVGWRTAWRWEYAARIAVARGAHRNALVARASATMACAVKMAYWRGVKDAFTNESPRSRA